MYQVQQVFEELVKNPSASQASERLKTVALALWYEGFVPDLENLEPADKGQAGFVVDKLTRYNCLEKSKKESVRSTLLPKLATASQAGQAAGSVSDTLASYWGAHCNLKAEFKALLPYQRRHYRF